MNSDLPTVRLEIQAPTESDNSANGSSVVFEAVQGSSGTAMSSSGSDVI